MSGLSRVEKQKIKHTGLVTVSEMCFEVLTITLIHGAELRLKVVFVSIYILYCVLWIDFMSFKSQEDLLCSSSRNRWLGRDQFKFTIEVPFT